MRRALVFGSILAVGLTLGLLLASCTSDAPTGTPPPAGGPVVTPADTATPLSEQEAARRVDEIIGGMRPTDRNSLDSVEDLVDLGRPAVPAFLDQLDSPNVVVRWAAIYALSRLAEPSDVEQLAEGLNDHNLSNRTVVAATLLAQGDDRGIDILEDALESEATMAFSHPPKRLSDYARRVLDDLRPGSGSGSRGGILASPRRAPNLRDVEAALRNCTANITLNLQFTGTGATEALAKTWADAIEKMWDGQISRRCCEIDVTVNTKVGGSADANYAQIIVIKVRPHMQVRENMTLGGSSVSWNISGRFYDTTDGLTAAHEAGHAMGVDDEYTDDPDGGGSIPTGFAVGEGSAVGAGPSIMAQVWNDAQGDAPDAKIRHADSILTAYGLVCPEECLRNWTARTPTPTPTNTPPPPPTPTNTPTPTPTSVPPATPTPTPTNTPTPTPTDVPTSTPTSTPTPIPSPSPTPTPTPTSPLPPYRHLRPHPRPRRRPHRRRCRSR